MVPIYFPLRWESTGDQWWYASPIDWAAANGHYDLVRELLKIDNNHLIKLTSLRRIRRLETVWDEDDDVNFHDVAMCRAQVARELFIECETKKGKNSLLKAGYGGWLLYTAASAGDLGFVRELLERDSLLVFGEGEYGVTDVLYASARSKSSEVFRMILDFAASPRLTTGKGGELEEHIGEIPMAYRWEVMNRAAHAAARGGNLEMLKEILGDGCCSDDVWAYRDVVGSSILHAAASKGQVEVVKYLVGSFGMIDGVDNQGNTALHTAAYKGQLAVVKALVTASPQSILRRNNTGETLLHMAVSGFEAPAFKRLDRQMELMRQLIQGHIINVEEIVNVQNDRGRTALHVAIVGNVHLELIQLLMTVRGINVNLRDRDEMTPLDLIKRRPSSASSDILIRRLISAGAVFGAGDFTRQVIASQLKMRGNTSSPGTSFKIADSEIFLHTGIENALDPNLLANVGKLPSSFDSAAENEPSIIGKKPGTSATSTAQQLRKVLLWPHKRKKSKEDMPVPVPLRQRFSDNPSSICTHNKRTLSVRTNATSPSSRKKLRQGLVQGMPLLNLPRHTHSSSFSRTSISSLLSIDKPEEILVGHDAFRSAMPPPDPESFEDDTPSLQTRRASFRRRYFCFGGSSLLARKPTSRKHNDQTFNLTIPSVA
ncbi:hypothetical protein MLD38_000122 [Melastoma candidum]|uniref:Uncharacterized protein n=1 Tax=Melastoma candidum TaxID=119954 RepID=A0ACB9S9Y4_9MYRT|nr:hypothetical protein MLD38_000122 [Melastoma candidum]